MTKEMQATLDNLKIMRDYLTANPVNDEDFNMSTYGVYAYNNANQVSKHRCDTVGCLLGHGAKAFDLICPQYYAEYPYGFSYIQFSNIIFPMLSNGRDGNKSWHFLFSDEWSLHQPSFSQAMERLNYFIDNNGVLPEWNYAASVNECFKNYLRC